MYDRGDYDSYRHQLSLVDWDALFITNDVDAIARAITDELIDKANKNIPNRIITVRKDIPPWLTADIKRMIRKLELTISIRPLVGKKLQEGISAELCCTSHGRPPADNLMWIKDMQIIKNVKDKKDCYKFLPLYRHHAGKYVCTVNNTIDFASITKYVYVLYPPNVNVQMYKLKNVVQLNCSATGLPSKNKFEEWEHRSEFNEHIRYVQGTHGNQLIIEGNDYHNSGIYICNVTNGISAINGNLFMTGQIEVPYRGEAIENRLYQSAHVLEASAIQNQLSEGYEIGVISNVSSPSIVLPRNQEETQDERSPNTQLSQVGNPNLNYADLVFEAAGPSIETNSRSIIHGAEDRTLYSEIDLLRIASARPSTSGRDDDDFIYVYSIDNFT
ncbi:unnamed protein product [Mytilus coruscus]|uniref:Ig-like domain-containing protein n=1 Tax=Mytilus coruscus TaxID=42192 RepID=A0A6J8CCP7_MYTCO|nr:unnamed protein product [Mytilus coruscus]